MVFYETKQNIILSLDSDIGGFIDIQMEVQIYIFQVVFSRSLSIIYHQLQPKIPHPECIHELITGPAGWDHSSNGKGSPHTVCCWLT